MIKEILIEDYCCGGKCIDLNYTYKGVDIQHSIVCENIQEFTIEDIAWLPHLITAVIFFKYMCSMLLTLHYTTVKEACERLRGEEITKMEVL